jgi:hypothetical protein
MVLLNKYKYQLVIISVLVFTIVVYTLNKALLIKSKKLVTIYGGVSNNINSDIEYKQQIHYLATHLDNRFDYLTPNDKTGAIGYLLDTLEKTDISQNIETTTFVRLEGGSETVNKHYKITYFDSILEFEEDLLTRCDIAIFLPGGIGTNYELAYSLFVMLEKIADKQIILLNLHGAFDYMINKIEQLHKDGYLRPDVYKLYKENCLIVKSAKEIIAILNKTDHLL